MSQSPRRTNFKHPQLAKREWSTDKPAEDSFAWRMWLGSQDLAQQALASDFVTGIAQGALDPRKFGYYTIQDCAYCMHGQEDYLTATLTALQQQNLEVAAFARARYESYKDYTASQMNSWHLASATSVLPGKAAQAYIEFESWVANNLDPVYLIIAMLPCDQLWPWLAEQVAKTQEPGGAYDFWPKANSGFHGAYRLDNFVNAMNDENALDYETALFVFRSCMTGEVNFFHSACGQELLPMPKKPD